MKNIWIGFVLIFLDFSLTLGNSRIGLIPDFLGYIVLMNGLSEMSRESPQFERVRPYAVGMAAYTGILYAMDVFGISVSLGGISYLLGIVSTLVSLSISHHIVLGVREIEEIRGVFLSGEKLKSAWNWMAIFSVIAFLAIWIPLLAVFCVIAGFIASVYFLAAFSKTKNLYYGPAV